MQKLMLSPVRTLANLMVELRFPGKDRLLTLICPRINDAVVNLFGYRVHLDLTDHIQHRMFLNADWHDMRVMRDNVKDGMTVFDIGCNVGVYSLLASSLVGSRGKVYAFEPNPRVYQRLAQTIKDNEIKNIFVFNSGIGANRGELTLYPNVQPGNASATMVADGQSFGFAVPIETIDNVMAAQNVACIDYMKIDVDGFEPSVLKGAAQTLKKKKIRFLQSEFSDYWLKRNGSSPLELYRSVIENGFRDLDGVAQFFDGGLTDRFFELDSKI
jgi:FkbM family methyltransferase